jgi:hypothetical protein
LLDEIAQLPLADRQIFGGLFGFHKAWKHGIVLAALGHIR